MQYLEMGFKEWALIRKALDGEAGLKMVAEEKPELILLDIIMPKLDGFSVLKRLKANEATKDIPVVLLTNLGQNEDVDKGQKLGAVGYLVKANLTPSEVVKKVKEFLNKQHYGKNVNHIKTGRPPEKFNRRDYHPV